MTSYDNGVFLCSNDRRLFQSQKNVTGSSGQSDTKVYTIRSWLELVQKRAGSATRDHVELGKAMETSGPEGRLAMVSTVMAIYYPESPKLVNLGAQKFT